MNGKYVMNDNDSSAMELTPINNKIPLFSKFL